MTAKEFFKDEQPEYVEMFRRLALYVHKDLDQIELHKTGKIRFTYEWPYSEYEWAEEDENEYKKWLIDHVYKHSKKFGISHATKKMIKDKFVSHFLLNYSWMYK